MNVFIFGNQDLEQDSLPLLILPKLKKKFPNIKFQVKDPNEELDTSDPLFIIDTVAGVEKVTIFTNLKNFAKSPNLTLHDFDLFSNLRLLEKLNKLPKIKIVGIPPTLSKSEALKQVSLIFSSSSL